MFSLSFSLPHTHKYLYLYFCEDFQFTTAAKTNLNLNLDQNPILAANSKPSLNPQTCFGSCEDQPKYVLTLLVKGLF